jgi:catalase
MIKARNRIRLLLGYSLAVCISGAIAGVYFRASDLMPASISSERVSPARIVDGFEAVSGRHPGFRRNHAKGICVTGYFDSNGHGAALSRAHVFAQGRVTVVGRMSILGGDPAQTDASSPVRSLALSFTQDDGRQWRTAMNSVPVFPVRTPRALYELLVALRPDTAPGKEHDTKMRAFMQSHPESAAFQDWIGSHAPSSGFDNSAYYSVSAFRFIDSRGTTHDVRWSLAPETPYSPLPDAPSGNPDFLEHGLVKQLQRGPLRWHMMISIAQRGDPIDDATRLWPADRTQIDVGTLVIDTAQSQIDGPCRDISFDPLILPDGIAPSSDPLLAARSAAYAESLGRRASEESRLTGLSPGAHP